MTATLQHAGLPNGLEVVAEADASAHTAAVGFFVRAGARDESPELMGVSHFLEHMMFKGTARRSADDVNREFDELGADYNAYTSHENTVYYAHVLPEMLPRAIDLLADMLRPSLREDDFNVEKKVILEEISMYEDRPEWRLQDALLEGYFGAHALGHRVLGTADTVGAMTADQMRGYFTQRYAPGAITVSVAGKFDYDAVLAQITELCGGWDPGAPERQHGAVAPTPDRLNLTDAKLSRCYLAMLMPGPSAQDEARFAAMVLSDLLGDDDGSRLHWALIDPGLAEEAALEFMPQDRSGAFLGFAACEPSRADEVEKTLTGVLAGAAEDLTDDELTRTVNKLATRITLTGERPSGRMHDLGSGWTYRRSHLSLQERLDKLQALTPASIRELLEQYPLRPVTVARLGPG
ncbi:MAG: pitrilysin family protein [Planctomycetota bacterium]